MVIVVCLSLVGILLIPVFQITIVLMREYRAPLLRALIGSFRTMLYPSNRRMIVSEFLQLALFMGLGLLIAKRYMTGATNSGKTAVARMQLDSLRPNPAYASSGETEQAF